MAKKKQALSPEERLAAALVPEEEWPYALPDGWKWVRIGALNDYKSSSITPSTNPDDTFELYSVPSIVNDYPEITKGMDIGSTKQLVEKDDVLLCKINPRINRVWKVSAHTTHKCLASSEWIVVRARSFFASDYLMWFFRCPYFRERMLSNVSGVGGSLMRAKPRFVQTYPVALPSLSEQHRLVARIESLFAKLDAAREKVQSVLDSHETRKAALLHDAFAGKLTAKWREENNKRACYAEEPLKNFVETQYGYTEKSSFDIAGPHYLRITDIQGETVDWNNVPNCSIDETNYQKYSLHPNDIVVARTGATTGKSYMIGEDIDAVFASYLIRVQITNIRLLPKFLYMFFQSQEYWSQIMELSAGIAQPGVNARKIQSMMICVPSLPEQQEIVRILDRLLAREQRARQAAEETLTAIDRMKQSILARAFRGEL